MFYTVFAIIAVIGAALYAVLPKGRLRGWGVVFYAVITLAIFVTSVGMLGASKPMNLEWQSMKRLRIISFYWDREGQTVHMWVLRNGTPVAYVYPYPDKEKAEKLQDNWRRKQAEGDVEFYTSDEEEEIAKVEHEQFKLPDKE